MSGNDDEPDDDPGAELYADAENALYRMPRGTTKTAIKKLLLGQNVDVDDEDERVELDDLLDRWHGWSLYRVNGYVLLYKPFTDEQREELGRSRHHPGGLARSLVADIITLDEYLRRYESGEMT